MRTAWLTATANIQWFTKIGSDGSCLIPDFTHCTEEMMQAIESTSVEERESPGGENVTRIRLTLKNSVRAMEVLARAMGRDRREVRVGAAGDMSMGPNAIERLKRLLVGDPQGLQSEDSDGVSDSLLLSGATLARRVHGPAR